MEQSGAWRGVLAAVVLPRVLADLAGKTVAGLGNRDFEVEVRIKGQTEKGNQQAPEYKRRPRLSGKLQNGRHCVFYIRKQTFHVNMTIGMLTKFHGRRESPNIHLLACNF